MAQKVSNEVIQRLQKQQVQDNGIIDPLDKLDRGTGRVFSKIGKFFTENW